MSIDAKNYIHDDDLAALEALKAIPGFSQLMKAFLKEFSERQGHLRNMSSFIRIDKDQLPKYAEMLPPICEKLGIEVPELYLMMDVRPNAFTSGETKPYIVLTSGLLDTLPDELIPTILAHECGHIACHHVLYRTMGGILLGGTAGTMSRLPLGSLFTLPLQVAFFYWMRCSEYSADRAAVLCDGGADKMAEVCMRLAGFSNNINAELNREAFMNQAKEYRNLIKDSKWDKTMEFYMLANASHPFMSVRALECTEWAASEQYRQVLDGTWVVPERKKPEEKPLFDFEELYKKIVPETPKKTAKAPAGETICPHCGTANRSGAVYCKNCGKPLEAPEILCPECGEKLDGTETFCPHCGHKMK